MPSVVADDAEGVELGRFLGRVVGSRRESAHSLNLGGGFLELEDVVVSTTAAPVRFRCRTISVNGEAQDFYNQDWMVCGIQVEM